MLPVLLAGYELLFQPEVVRIYISLLKESKTPAILEAAAGAIQNLCAGSWTVSAHGAGGVTGTGRWERHPWGLATMSPAPGDTVALCSLQYGRCIRSALRQEKGLSAIADLLTHDSERVVKAASGALRNLAVDLRNKELIGEDGTLPVSVQDRQELPPAALGCWGSVWEQRQASLCLLPAPKAESAELCREGQQNGSPVSGFPCLLTRSSLSFPGKHAIPNLVKNLPGGQQTPAKNLSEDTVVSILNTINEVIVDNLEAAKKLRETQGIEKLVLINKSG